ncbi:MAG: TonB family protein [Prevotellaceae bacterium]|nr:TonB family protein [Prevotellaceae bacterium]
MNFKNKHMRTSSTFMRHIIISLLLAVSVPMNAQFFFGFPQQEVQRKKENYNPPTFKGGDAAIEKFISKNFRQPANRELVDGKIVVAVIVKPNGKVAETHVVRSVTNDLNAEAVNVCRKMKFRPAKQGKKKVKGRIDISFPVKHGRVSFVNLPTIEV